MKNRTAVRTLCLLLCLAAGLPFAGAGEAEQLAKFNKDYNNPSAAARKTAVDALRGATELAALQRLGAVAASDPDEGVQAAAFDALCTGADPDGRVAQLACQVFLSAKNREAKIALVASLEKLEFKLAPLQNLMKFMEGLVYPLLPDPNDTIRQPLNQQEKDPLAKVNKSREEFEKCMSAINSLAGKSFTGTPRTKNEIKQWWRTGEAAISAQDQKLREEKKKAATPVKK